MITETFGDVMLAPAPSDTGRDNLTDIVDVYAHHSGSHDGINVEIDAPAGVRITVHINEGLSVDLVVPE